MANKVKIKDQNGVQVFPVTHVSAVIDNNGNPVDQILDAQTDLINQKQLEIGAVESDLTPTYGSSHWVTSGGVYNAIATERDSGFNPNNETTTGGNPLLTLGEHSISGTITGTLSSASHSIILYAGFKAGKTYRLTFDYVSQFNFSVTIRKSEDVVMITSGSLSSGSGSVSVEGTLDADSVYVDLLARSGAQKNQTVELTNFYVYEVTTVKEELLGNKNNIQNLALEDKSAGDSYITNHLLWEQGSIASATGLDTDSTTRIRTKGMHHATGDFTITPDNGYQIYIYYYDDGGNYIGKSGWNTSAVSVYAGEYYRLVFANTSNTALIPSDTSHFSISDGYGSERLEKLSSDCINSSIWGGNLFVPADVTVPSGSIVTVTASGNSLTFKTTSNPPSNKPAMVSFPTLVVGRRYRITMDFSLSTESAIALRRSDSSAVKTLTTKRSGSGSLSCVFTYTSDIEYIGHTVYSGVPKNTTYTYSNIQLYEIANGDGSDVEVVDLDSLTVFDGYIDPSNEWNTNRASDAVAKYVLIDVSSHCGGQAVISTSANTVVEFLLDDSHQNTIHAHSAANSSRVYINTLDNCGKYIPEDAQFLYVSFNSTIGASNKPTSVTLVGGYCKKRVLSEFEDIVRKRAVQMTNLRWNALSNISGNYITAGVHIGMLYSSCVEVDRYIGHDISVRTFMTAANNPYSLLYTEDLAARTSGYGFTYHNRGNTVHAWMGTVCSRFVFSCLGYTEWDTATFAWLCRQGILHYSKSQASSDVEIGDVIWINGHTRIIFDVIKYNGSAVKIIVTEANMPLVLSTEYTPSELDSYMSENHGIFYKYSGERNMVYEPSEFVNNLGEPLLTPYSYNDDICTYAGDYAAFRTGYPVFLNYNLKSIGGWTSIQLYKENWSSANVLTLTLVNTYTIDTSLHRLQIPSEDIESYGKYRARLTDGSNYSDYTYFEVIETVVGYDVPDAGNPNVKRITFSSSNGTPQKIAFCEIGGTPMAVRPLTLQERIDGYVSFNPIKACSEQRGGTMTHNSTFIKVYFVGQYGRVTNEPLLSDI